MKKLSIFIKLFLIGLFSSDLMATPSSKGIGAIPVGTTLTLPNYSGALYTANRNTTLLNLIGGINEGLTTKNIEFPTAQLYDLPAPAQPEISEDSSIAGVTADHVAREQETNICQIYQHAINISYLKMANGDRMSGLNTNPGEFVVEDEIDFQVDKKLKIVARDLNYVLHNGVYAKATVSSNPHKTRGLLTAIDSLGGTAVDAGGLALAKLMIDAMLKGMYTAGANFENMVMLMGSAVKIQVSEIYAFAPQDRNIGGVNIKQIETDFGNIMVALDPDVPAGVLACYDLAPLSLVFQTVPGKGNLFYEVLAKTGASEKGQLFGIIGFDHGPGFLHGKVTNILV